ncbi:enoyl-CoA hydratase/isomerase family protein [Bradyrhizobium manausense]|uniref:enoyl-CoA hydratase/isomerase family protein n=1 Tax=Bradyrhizobium manausense TaxID=989370 RepID=UPI001BA56D48|nr:enoyl-CoA hydratase/isomerase family protein [Bradyrhizobium manausense]MBR0687771.1 enoyl-CoA hydratase/isomerase family protein [Bradyrhizobium manausense]
MTDSIRIVPRRDDILEIVLASSASGNLLSPPMVDAIAQAFEMMSPTTRAVYLHADGPDFCAGRRSAMPPSGTRVTALDLRHSIADPILDFYQRIRDLSIPLVMAVQGKAAGVGCALAGLADVCIASDDAEFSVPEMDKDIAPTLVMAALSDRLPRAALARLVFARDSISASEARAIGLVGMTCSSDQLRGQAEALLAKLCRNSVPTLRGVKSFLKHHPEASFAARRETAALINCVVMAEKYR